MTSKAIKGYKFIVGGKSRPGIIGVKPKSGGVVDEFKSRKLKQLGRTQRKLKSQDKEMGEAIKGAQKKGLSRKDTVKGRKFQRDNRRAQREGDKLRKDVLRAGRAMGGVAEKPIYKFKDEKGNFKRPKAEGKPSKINERPKAVPLKREEMKKGGKALKPVDKQKNPGLAKLPTKVRNKMGYMKKGGRVRKFGGGKK
jgi:hypothetical protein